jgi:hypothetical protein
VHEFEFSADFNALQQMKQSAHQKITRNSKIHIRDLAHRMQQPLPKL